MRVRIMAAALLTAAGGLALAAPARAEDTFRLGGGAAIDANVHTLDADEDDLDAEVLDIQRGRGGRGGFAARGGSFRGGSFRGGSAFRGGSFRGGSAFRGGSFRGGYARGYGYRGGVSRGYGYRGYGFRGARVGYGYRGYGFRGARVGYGYRGYGYRPWGWGVRRWAWPGVWWGGRRTVIIGNSGYYGAPAYYYSSPYYDDSYYDDCPIGGADAPVIEGYLGTETPFADEAEQSPPPRRIMPPAPAEAGERTFPYDGGPRIVPAPQPRPALAPTPALVPGRVVSLPSAGTPTYRAYGQSPSRPAFADDRTYLTGSKPTR